MIKLILSNGDTKRSFLIKENVTEVYKENDMLVYIGDHDSENKELLRILNENRNCKVELLEGVE